MSGHEHIRTCIACGRQVERSQLVRIVRLPDGSICLDESKQLPGRGAYVCNASCFEKAQSKQRIARALKTSVSEEEMREMVSRF